ncbi:superfamily I DNA/RNA helicase/RecB family exonuclease [Cryobacterium sp. MP_M5]|uniref:ATP-dependent helicase n=1 Tax=unclassified Cryobacterium TaxID=2649013 RepID=UPI001A2A227E|nr:MULTISPECIES: ATP-dependent DNA helicase [unclassified Cryobacterium]MBG6057342.1 superfamily I DNA/RNA helicase/RecB family exonuclease [Cryobacterium sp. MP_M3]MEC5175541.1 superfamily I DNA/RNA helicase/RecB family exonuclease [Cryobacterium sp. MP_M5]
MTTLGFAQRTDTDSAAGGAANPAGSGPFGREAGPNPVGLDEAQRAVVDLADGISAAVIGAPGTGKTTALVELVADRVLQRGYSPSEVLVLVPTRTGATALRDRLALRLGVPTNGPLARTANSVAFQIVRDAVARAGGPAPTLLTGGEQDQIIAELLEGHRLDRSGPDWPDTLGADVRALRGFRTELRDLMMRAVEYGVTADALARLGRSNDRPEWVAAAEFIRGYEDVKDQSRPSQYDSTELAQFAAAVVAEAPAGPAGAAVIGGLAGLRLIVLDDAQELTQGVLTLIRQFAARGVAVVAVGDPDISTGSFHGAHPDALGRLSTYLGGIPVTTLVLGTVYRHGDAIRQVVQGISHRIGAAAAGLQRAAAVPVVAAAGKEPETPAVQAVLAASPADQLAVVARRLRERHVLGGIPWGRMAVAVRSGSLVPSLSRGLAGLEVPTQVSSAQTALRDEYAVRAFILALEITLGRKTLDTTTAVDLLRGPLGGLDPITLRRLRAALRQQELSQQEPSQQEPSQQEPSPDDLPAAGRRSADELLVDALADPGLLGGIDNRTARRAASCGESLRAAAVEYDAGATIEELLWGLWQRSGLAREWHEQAAGTGIVADEANHNLDAVVALFSAAQRYVERTPAAPPVLFLEHLVDTDVPEDTLAPRALGDAVVVSTPSGLIGRDFDLVVIAGVQANVWPDLRIRGSLLGAGDLAALAAGLVPQPGGERTAVLHDELRMFAQCASRARTELLVTAVDNEDNEPSVFLRLLPEAVATGDLDAGDASRYPLSLRGLVGRLRRDLTRFGGVSGPGGEATDRATDRATEAAATLARLAREGVAGAAPDQWYGLTDPSTVRPLNDPEAGDGPVRVSPSRMAAFETCPLHWVIGQVGGGTSNTAANLGTIIHKVLEESADRSPDALWQAVDARWDELHFDADWQSRLQKIEARVLTDRLASYLLDFEHTGGALLSAEGTFALDVDGAVLSGTVDRVERLRDGRAVIVDLKTGRGDPISDAGVAEHPQLGAYQLAFTGGAIDGIPPGTPLAGARLVIVSSGTVKQNYRNPTQPAFTPDELDAFRRRVGEDAAGMGAATFVAEISSHCLDPRSHGSCRIHVIKQVSS